MLSTKQIGLFQTLRMKKAPRFALVSFRQFAQPGLLKTIAALFLGGVFVAVQGDLRAATFVGGAITFNDGTTGITLASPYPSAIAVSGLGASLSSVTLTLTNFTRSARPADLEMLLVGPTGATLIPFSNVGGTTSTGPENLVLSDAGSSFLSASSLTAGTFRPTDNSSTTPVFPTPAPSGPYGSAGPIGSATFTSQFGGTNPNGTWNLFIVDGTPNTGGETGSITGWSLNITASPVPEPGSSALLIAGTAMLSLVSGRRRERQKTC